MAGPSCRTEAGGGRFAASAEALVAPLAISRIGLFFNFNDHLYFYRYTHRQDARSHRGPDMPAFFSENLDKKVRCAVDYFRLIEKIGAAIYKTEDFDDVPDLVERA